MKQIQKKKNLRKKPKRDKIKTKRKPRKTAIENKRNYVESESSESVNPKAKTQLPRDKDLSEIAQLSIHSGNEDTIVMDR